MRWTWMVIVALALPGCRELDFDKKIKFPETDLRKTFVADRSVEADLIRSFQTEDRILRYLSNGKYSCGDPGSRDVQDYTNNSPAKIVAAEDKGFEKFSEEAFKVYKDYLDTLAAHKKSHEEWQASINAFAGLLNSTASALSVAGSSDVVGALRSVALQLRNERTRFTIHSYAEVSQPALKKMADDFTARLKKGPLIDRNRALRLWSTCARERLIFMRDAPLGKVGEGRYKALGTQASVAELASAYAAYVEKKNTYSSDLQVIQALEDILEANANLIKSTSEDDANAVIGALSNFIDLYSETSKFINSR